MALLYEFHHVQRAFQGPGEEILLFKDLSFHVEEGESLAIVGASGSGKSTLLHLMGALDSPTAGEIFFAGNDLSQMNATEKAYFRNKTLGFIYQFHHLLPEFNAEENVAMPALIGGISLASILPKAREMLDLVGLGARLKAKVSTLSGGERQRVAIARAVLQHPRVILADEPTGNLDTQTGVQIEELLLRLNKELGTTLVIVTHNLGLASHLDRCLELRKGALHPLRFGAQLLSEYIV
ncbi:MAG: ABC transporter ATP-binding protein [Desulfovibrionaceae bacterium]|nr:ABC transporter ATP-binding protein [Desulfovibrionaceae bacterium]